MNQKMKGNYGYITYKKKTSLGMALLMVLIGLGIFVVGLLLNKMSGRNVFSIFGMLMVLPMAKYLTTYIVMFPYKSPSKESFERFEESCGGLEDVYLFSDLVLTSTEKVMNLDFMAVGNGYVVALQGKDKPETKYIQQYLEKGCRNWMRGMKVRIVTTEDGFYKEFKMRQGRSAGESWDEKEREEVLAYLRSLLV